MAAADLAMLQELAEMAMDMARLAHRHAAVEAEEHPERFDPVAATNAFAKAARAVRLTVSLKQRMMDQSQVRAEDSPEQVKRLATVESRAAVVLAFVGHALELVDRQAETDRVCHDLLERLEREGDDFLLDTAIEQTVLKICDGLGVATPWAAADEAKQAEREAARYGASETNRRPP